MSKDTNGSGKISCPELSVFSGPNYLISGLLTGFDV